MYSWWLQSSSSSKYEACLIKIPEPQHLQRVTVSPLTPRKLLRSPPALSKSRAQKSKLKDPQQWRILGKEPQKQTQRDTKWGGGVHDEPLPRDKKGEGMQFKYSNHIVDDIKPALPIHNSHSLGSLRSRRIYILSRSIYDPY